MKLAIWLIVIAVLIIAGYTYLSGQKKNEGGGIMKVESVFKNEGEIPREYTCDGANVSPQLSITAIPSGTKALAIIVDDPDAPIGTFTHWVAWNIEVNSENISVPKAVPRKSSLMVQGINDFGRIGYDGPCPPRGHGKHHYHFKVYALDAKLDLKEGARKKDLETAMKGHILSSAEIVGVYGR
jgi:Raf kinase inhibitor-like YbhB/YbcL family protein